MEIGGTPYPLADMGLDVTFTLGANGAAEMNTNGDVDSIHCTMQSGVLMAGGISSRCRTRSSRFPWTT